MPYIGSQGILVKCTTAIFFPVVDYRALEWVVTITAEEKRNIMACYQSSWAKRFQPLDVNKQNKINWECEKHYNWPKASCVASVIVTWDNWRKSGKRNSHKKLINQHLLKKTSVFNVTQNRNYQPDKELGEMKIS